MTNTLFISALLIGLLLFFTSCKTYYIPVESFRQQLSGFDSSNMREVTTRGPVGDRVTYKTYPIDIIHAVDKGGNPVNIPNSPAIEVRITDTANKKTIFYFDVIQFDGENIIGRQSRFISSIKKTIPLSSIKTIEVQNGRKNFRYVQ
jgi:predicted RNA-binding protein YlqC (UPF0109 family)